MLLSGSPSGQCGDLFLREAAAQSLEARSRARGAWSKFAGAVIWFALFDAGVFPRWITFSMMIFVSLWASDDWQRARLARAASALALRFHFGFDR